MGETMAVLTVPADGRIDVVDPARLGFGGAESNVAIGLARLGVRTHWCSRVGQDALGALVVRGIRAEGVVVHVDENLSAATGLLVKELSRGSVRRVRYYRSGSAASTMTPAGLDRELIEAATVLHLTGITPALGPGPLETVAAAMRIARSAGTMVSFDINYRSSLWAADDAGPVLRDLVGLSDLVFASREEAEVVLYDRHGGPPAVSSATTAELARSMRDLGPREVVIKLGHEGSYAFSGAIVEQVPTRPVIVTDAIGAGDAFVAGYLSQLVSGGDVRTCLARGNLLGGILCRSPGDWESLPTAAELSDLDSLDEVVR